MTELFCNDDDPLCGTGQSKIEDALLGAGTYYIIAAASSTGEIGLTVTYGDPIDAATNDTCGSPIDVSAGGRFDGTMVEVADDYDTVCSFSGSPDLVYTFTTTEVRDVQISAQAPSGDRMAYSVRTTCDSDASAVRCDYGDPAAGVLHQLPAGTYFIIVEGAASRDVDFTLDVQFLAPTPATAGDSCSNAIPLALGVETSGTLFGLENDHDVSCGFRYDDAVYSFELTEDADVTVEVDAGVLANASVRTTCTDGALPSQIRCTSGNPVRQRIRNLAAGTYFVIVESATPGGFTIEVDATTPPTIPVDVTGNDNCGSAFVIPATGGLFHGDTTSLLPDYAGTSCGGGAGNNDAAFQLVLTERRRVVAATQGSLYDTVLHIQGATCRSSGGDIYCDDDAGEGLTSLIDRNLDPGTYHIIVDGFGGAGAGEYFLEVMLLDPT